MIAVIPFAVLQPYLRAWKPRTDLPEKQGEGSVKRDEKAEAATAAKQERRNRKRERQMEAFRRSKRG